MEKEVKQALLESVEEMGVVTQEFMNDFADEYDVSKRSIMGVLRANGIEYEKSSNSKVSKYTEDEVNTIIEMANDGAFVEEIAEAVNKPVKSVRGKCLALLKSGDIDEIPKVKEKKSKTYQSNYTDAQVNTIVTMAKQGKFIEEIAEAVNMPVKSVRGKCLALLKAEMIDSIPKTKNKKEKTKFWTEEKLEKAKEIYLNTGKNLDATAKQMGVSVQSVRSAISRNFPDVYQSTAKQKAKFWTEEKEQELKKLYEEFGVSAIDEIADKLGTTKLVVFKQLKKLGIDYKTDLEALKEVA